MPIYEYQCQACGHYFDWLQKVSDPPLTDCPDCGKPELRKLVSAPNFRLKGSGWYETDFKTGDKRNLADGAGADAKSGSADSKDGADKKDDAGKKKSAESGKGGATKSGAPSGGKKSGGGEAA